MAKSDDALDRVFREKLENHQENPSLGAWDNLANQLDTKQAPQKRNAWWAIAASITLALGAAFLFWSIGEEPEKQVTLTEAHEINKDVVINPPVNPSTSSEAEKDIPSNSTVSTSVERAQIGIKTQHQNSAASEAEVITQNEAVPATVSVYTAEVVPQTTEQVPSPAIPLVAAPNSINTPSTNEVLAEEGGYYRIRIYSDGLQKGTPQEKNLVSELGKTVGQVEGLLGKLDEGYVEIQEKKGRLFSSLTSRREASPGKQ